MTPREIGQQLTHFNAGRGHDPVVDPIATRATALETQLATVKRKQAETQQADVNAHLLAETALANGDKVDRASLQRLRADVVEAEHSTQLLSNALEQVRRDIANATAARAERDVAMLTPIFRDLASLLYERATAVVEIEALFRLAHDTANSVLPGTSNELQQGFGGLLTRERLEHWRARTVTAGLLAATERHPWLRMSSFGRSTTCSS